MKTWVELLILFGFMVTGLLSYMKSATAAMENAKGHALMAELHTKFDALLVQFLAAMEARAKAEGIIEGMATSKAEYSQVLHAAPEAARKEAVELLSLAEQRAEKLIEDARILATSKLKASEESRKANTIALGETTAALGAATVALEENTRKEESLTHGNGG